MEGFNKYGKIKHLGDEENKHIFEEDKDVIYVQEKIDGGNFRIYIKDGVPIFGSRTQQLTSDDGEDINVAKNFRRCVDYVREKLKDRDLSFLNNHLIYGECCVKHSMDYNWQEIPPFILFDIKCPNGEWMLPQDYEQVAEILEIAVPKTMTYLSEELKRINIDDSFVPVSEYAPLSTPDMKAEGVVFKRYREPVFAKYVRSDFKEMNRQAFGTTKSHSTNYTEWLVAAYCTNPRIEKIVWKLMDEDKKLELALMPFLSRRVYEDIMEEHWRDICLGKKDIVDFRLFWKLITKRCFTVLKQIITNNALNEE